VLSDGVVPIGNLPTADGIAATAELVEYTPEGTFLAERVVDPNNGGAFGLATYKLGWGTFRLAAVDDNANTMDIWTTVAP